MKLTRVLLALSVPVVLLAGAELGYRAFVPKSADIEVRLKSFRMIASGRDAVYRTRPHTSYGLNPDFELASVPVNSAGFRGPEWTVERTPGTTRVLCLGASTTEGGNGAGYKGSYPFLLEAELKQTAGREVEVLNAGVSGWTTAETLVAWFLRLQDYAPDVVVIHHAVNDVMPRNSRDFEPDYSHWRRPLSTPEYAWWQRFLVRFSDFYALRLMKRGDGNLRALATVESGMPLPFAENKRSYPSETGEPFARNVRSIGRSAAAMGAQVVLMTMPARAAAEKDSFASFRVGMRDNNESLRRLCEEEGWLLADAEQLFEEADDPTYRESFLDLVHVKPAGNAGKARAVAAALAGSPEAPGEAEAGR